MSAGVIFEGLGVLKRPRHGPLAKTGVMRRSVRAQQVFEVVNSFSSVSMVGG